ncbi:MAG: hypothetical protein LBE50_02440, partial [Gallionellaceae bacterium]|nr:hypothetical protein [Gallionellaceae bacterium]
MTQPFLSPSFQRKLESSAVIKILRRSRTTGFVRYAGWLFSLDSSFRWTDGITLQRSSIFFAA